MYSNVFSSEIRQQNRTEQNRTEQNRTEQNRTLTGLPCRRHAKRVAEQNGLPCQSRAKRIAEQLQNLFQLWNRIITRLILLQKKILQSLFQSFNRTIINYTKQNIIFNYFKIFYAIF